VAEPLKKDDTYHAYWDAFRRHVCSVCLDAGSGGTCGLSGRACALEAHFPRIIDAIATLDSTRMDDYVAAIEEQVCKRCPEQDPEGFCARRSHGECALYSYLSLVVDAIEEVRGGLGR
jgi:hypothetical protein